MKSINLLYCLLAAPPLVLGGCASPGGVAWGEEAGGGGGQMAEAGAATGATMRTGSVSTQLIGGTVAVIAQHEATARQRRRASERGRAWCARTAVSSRGAKRRHFIAVDTDPDNRTAPQAQRSVMIFDTEAQRVVGKNVYDVQSPPVVGAVARFDTYSAQYIGPGF